MTIYQCSTCGGFHDSAEPACAPILALAVQVAKPPRPWTEEARARGIAAGYGDVLFGKCDVEGVMANGDSLCKAPHERGPHRPYHPRHGSDVPEIRAILADLGIPTSSASCHWIGLDRQAMTAEQKAAVEHKRNWVNERWRDKHALGCPRLDSRYGECRCAVEVEKDSR